MDCPGNCEHFSCTSKARRWIVDRSAAKTCSDEEVYAPGFPQCLSLTDAVSWDFEKHGCGLWRAQLKWHQLVRSETAGYPDIWLRFLVGGQRLLSARPTNRYRPRRPNRDFKEGKRSNECRQPSVSANGGFPPASYDYDPWSKSRWQFLKDVHPGLGYTKCGQSNVRVVDIRTT